MWHRTGNRAYQRKPTGSIAWVQWRRDTDGLALWCQNMVHPTQCGFD